MPRPARPDDLYRLRVALDPRLSPDGRTIVFTLQTVAPTFDGYRHALWSVPADGSGAGPPADARRQARPPSPVLARRPHARLPLGSADARSRTRPRASSRASARTRCRSTCSPLDGGEARRLTDLPRGVDGFAWAPDGRRLVVTTSSHAADREADARARGRATRKPGTPPPSDYRFLDRLGYLFNGAGFVDDRETPPLDRRRRDRRGDPPDRRTRAPRARRPGRRTARRIAFAADRRAGRDITLPVEHPRRRRRPRGRRDRRHGRPRALRRRRPGWTTPRSAVLGHRFPARAGSRNDVWRFAADGSEATADRRHEPHGAPRPDVRLDDEQRRRARARSHASS